MFNATKTALLIAESRLSDKMVSYRVLTIDSQT